MGVLPYPIAATMLVGMGSGHRRAWGHWMVAFRIVVFYAEKTGRMHVNPGDPSGLSKSISSINPPSSQIPTWLSLF